MPALCEMKYFTNIWFPLLPQGVHLNKLHPCQKSCYSARASQRLFSLHKYLAASFLHSHPSKNGGLVASRLRLTDGGDATSLTLQDKWTTECICDRKFQKVPEGAFSPLLIDLGEGGNVP
uniref:Uncharacterized protein n=1 Tax=Sphaerodactylus townsendi TaxID=933632 RepID=A0ACB8ES08_9SAUR